MGLSIGYQKAWIIKDLSLKIEYLGDLSESKAFVCLRSERSY